MSTHLRITFHIHGGSSSHPVKEFDSLQAGINWANDRTKETGYPFDIIEFTGNSSRSIYDSRYPELYIAAKSELIIDRTDKEEVTYLFGMNNISSLKQFDDARSIIIDNFYFLFDDVADCHHDVILSKVTTTLLDRYIKNNNLDDTDMNQLITRAAAARHAVRTGDTSLESHNSYNEAVEKLRDLFLELYSRDGLAVLDDAVTRAIKINELKW